MYNNNNNNNKKTERIKDYDRNKAYLSGMTAKVKASDSPFQETTYNQLCIQLLTDNGKKINAKQLIFWILIQ